MGWHTDHSISRDRPVFSATYDLRCLADVLPISIASPYALIISWRQKRDEITMFIETVNKTPASSQGKRLGYLLSLLVALVFALAIYPTQTHAQIVGDIEVNIPFQFHAGNARLPAGKYRIHVLDDSNQAVMEIISADGSTSALFQVLEAQTHNTPGKNELIFNKYGNRYFLATLFDAGNPDGSRVVESDYEKRISQQTSLEGQEHVPAQHRTQQGK
jgi:hypothetical protein